MDTKKSDVEILTLALTTVEEMLNDRGYIPISSHFPEINVVDRVKNCKYFTPCGKFAIVIVVESSSQIKNFSKYIEDEEYETVLFVYMNVVTIAHKIMEKNLNNKIEIWSVYNLLVNISKHYLQPKIEKVTEELEICGKLPKISFQDPIVRYFCFKRKDILKITDSEGNIHYRTVV